MSATPAPRAIAGPLAVLAGAVGGLMLALALPAGPVAADPELVLLLRFMAAIKGGAALAVAALGAWRLSHRPAAPVAAGHVAAAAMTGFGSGLIWTLSHVVAGAACFYIGVAVSIACAWTGRDAIAFPSGGHSPSLRGAKPSSAVRPYAIRFQPRPERSLPRRV